EHAWGGLSASQPARARMAANVPAAAARRGCCTKNSLTRMQVLPIGNGGGRRESTLEGRPAAGGRNRYSVGTVEEKLFREKIPATTHCGWVCNPRAEAMSITIIGCWS